MLHLVVLSYVLPRIFFSSFHHYTIGVKHARNTRKIYMMVFSDPLKVIRIHVGAEHAGSIAYVESNEQIAPHAITKHQTQERDNILMGFNGTGRVSTGKDRERATSMST